MTKNIHTTLDEETYKLAVAHDIHWFQALKVGIEIMAGTPKEKADLLEIRAKTAAKLAYFDAELAKINEKEEKIAEKRKKNVYLTF
jgi:hypothetical protein